ncbi:serine/threonine-protein kinase 3-like [Lampetra planeri]
MERAQRTSGLHKLSDESLSKEPEEVFDVLEKLGEGSYGSVYKAIHKESGQVMAIKQVPVESELQEIIKEISIMQQCDSPYVVKYYGSYFKDTDLWIVMEFCGAGSVSDIIRLRNKTASRASLQSPAVVPDGRATISFAVAAKSLAAWGHGDGAVILVGYNDGRVKMTVRLQ